MQWKSSISSDVFRLFVSTVFPSAKSLATNRCFVVGLALFRPCRRLRHLISFLVVCMTTSLSHGVFLIQMSPIASNKIFGDVLGQLDCAFSRYTAIPAHNVSNFIASAHKTQIAIDSLLGRRVRKIFWSIPSSTFTYFVVSLVDCIVWNVHELLVCQFRQWRQCSSVDQEWIRNSVSIDCECRQRYFNYFKQSCLWVHELVVRIGCQRLSSRGGQWWAMYVDKLSALNICGTSPIFRYRSPVYRNCTNCICLSAP